MTDYPGNDGDQPANVTRWAWWKANRVIEEKEAENKRLLASLEKARSTIRTEMEWNKAHEAENERLRAALGRIDDLCDYAEGFYVGTPNDQIKVTIAAVRAAREAEGEG